MGLRRKNKSSSNPTHWLSRSPLGGICAYCLLMLECVSLNTLVPKRSIQCRGHMKGRTELQHRLPLGYFELLILMDQQVKTTSVLLIRLIHTAPEKAFLFLENSIIKEYVWDPVIHLALFPLPCNKCFCISLTLISNLESVSWRTPVKQLKRKLHFHMLYVERTKVNILKHHF